MNDITCKICHKKTNELLEYQLISLEEETTPDKYVIENEGTYNSETKKFYCTRCYIKIGMPTGTA